MLTSFDVPLSFMFAPGDAAIIAVVVLVLFGSTKIGPLMKSAGEGIKEFKKGLKDEDTASDKKETPLAANPVKDEEK